jgi:hypothetical protein
MWDIRIRENNQRNQSKQIQIYSFQSIIKDKGGKHHSEWQSKLTNLFPAPPLHLKLFYTCLSSLLLSPNSFPNSYPCDQFFELQSVLNTSLGTAGIFSRSLPKYGSCGRRWTGEQSSVLQSFPLSQPLVLKQ